jgi:hypothetical protein
MQMKMSLIAFMLISKLIFLTDCNTHSPLISSSVVNHVSKGNFADLYQPMKNLQMNEI